MSRVTVLIEPEEGEDDPTWVVVLEGVLKAEFNQLGELPQPLPLGYKFPPLEVFVVRKDYSFFFKQPEKVRVSHLKGMG